MDLSTVIRELVAEKERLEQAIALLEQLQRSESAEESVPPKKPNRRDRKVMEVPRQQA